MPAVPAAGSSQSVFEYVAEPPRRGCSALAPRAWEAVSRLLQHAPAGAEPSQTTIDCIVGVAAAFGRDAVANVLTGVADIFDARYDATKAPAVQSCDAVLREAM